MGVQYKIDMRIECDEQTTAEHAFDIVKNMLVYMGDNVTGELTVWNETSGKWDYVNV